MEQTTPESRVRHSLRVLRPLFWWLILVLALYAFRLHERRMEKTRLYFSVALQGLPAYAEATLDGKPVTSGEKISLGSHTLMITHPKAESYTRKLSTWYGGHNLGTIALKRGQGTLVVQADPPAAILTIRGPEFSVSRKDSSGITSSVPTDTYVVDAHYARWDQSSEIVIPADMTSSVRFAPRFGTLELNCNYPDGTFQLLTPNDRLVESGEFPSQLTGLPEGNYKLIASHHGRERRDSATVKAGVTNALRVEFVYGAALLETEPAGAAVLRASGASLGQTPLLLTELSPGSWRFTLDRNGYEPVLVSIYVSANQTNTIHTNLLSRDYTRSMSAAQEFFAAADYQRAAEAATAALKVKPDDPAAGELQRKASGQNSLRRAVELGKKEDYITGIKELESTLTFLPENEEAKQLLGSFKIHEPEQRERMRQERLERGRKVFAGALEHLRDERLFDSHELKTTRPVKEVEAAVLAALKAQPSFAVTGNDSPMPDTFVIDATQEMSTALATSAGRRRSIIVGAQTKDDETQILFKVLEYKVEAVNKFSIGALIHAPVAVNYIPIDASQTNRMTDRLQAQLKEGVTIVTERIQAAINKMEK